MPTQLTPRVVSASPHTQAASNRFKLIHEAKFKFKLEFVKYDVKYVWMSEGIGNSNAALQIVP